MNKRKVKVTAKEESPLSVSLKKPLLTGLLLGLGLSLGKLAVDAGALALPVLYVYLSTAVGQ